MINKLLSILCDPIDKSELKLKDNILIGKKNSYEVKDGVPIMLVDYPVENGWKLLWDSLQRKEYENSLKSPDGIFSHDGREMAVDIAKYLPQIVSGKGLDVGSGALARPAYMKNKLEWYGIDPYFGEKKTYPFVQGIGEMLPFKNNSFNFVFIGTSLEHCLDPTQVLDECYRVLDKDGKIVIWFSVRSGGRYEVWKGIGGLFDEHHRWAWDDIALGMLLRNCNFKEIAYTPVRINTNKGIMIGEKC